MIRFRVATYNVHKCKGIDWRTDPRRIAEVIREFDPDVLALQEVFDFQNEAIAQQTGLQFVFGAARNHSGQPYGNAVLTRLPVVESETYDVTTRAREPRKALRAALTLTSSAVLHFFAFILAPPISSGGNRPGSCYRTTFWDSPPGEDRASWQGTSTSGRAGWQRAC